MARFRFGLQPVLEHRERLESQHRQRLAAAKRDLLEAHARRDALTEELRSGSEVLRTSHGRFSADELRGHYAYLHGLAKAIEEHEVRVTACASHVERAQAALVNASRDKAVLDTLKSRRRDAYDAEASLAEARELDDANARAFGRREDHS